MDYPFFDCCEALKESLTRRYIPMDTLNVILSSLSASTKRNYNCVYKNWWVFRSCHKQTFFVADALDVLSFLQNMFDNGKKYSSLNTARAALSVLLTPVEPMTFGEDKNIKRWMKGAFKTRPQFPKYKSTWDPSTVLHYLSSLFPLDGLTLKDLTLKLTGLLALATAQRVQTLSLLKVQNVIKADDKICISITDIIKTSRPGAEQPLIVLPYFRAQPELCVASTLYFYLSKTQDLRTSDRILISFQKPYKPVGPQSISRWVKTVLERAGIDTSVFSAHSTRHATTSFALRQGVDINAIRKAAGWSDSSRVFNQFYNRPVDSSIAFASSVLEQ